MFLLTHFWLIVVSTGISLVVLGEAFSRRDDVLASHHSSLTGLASADKGQASYYLMLFTPIFTIVHHIIILFLPTYRPSHLDFDASPKGATLSKPSAPPTHAGGVYLAFLILISVLWSVSVLTTFFLTGLNVGREVKGTLRTGLAECAFGVIETGVSWVIFVMCMNQRVFLYDGVPSA